MILFVTILAFALMIFIHELGHYWTARRFGVGIEKFSIGFGKPLFRFQRKGVQWQIGWIPLGGYVKMHGENPDDEVEDAQRELSFQHKAWWQRALIAFSGPFANLILGLIFFIASFLFPIHLEDHYPVIHSVQGKWTDLLQPRDSLITINEQPVQGYWEALGLLSAKEDNSIQLMRNNEPLTVEIPAAQIDSLIRSLSPAMSTQIGEVYAGMSAWRAGIRSGDIVIGVDSLKVDDWYEMRQKILGSPSDSVLLTLIRDGKIIKRVVELESNVTLGEERLIGITNIQPVKSQQRFNIKQAFGYGTASAFGFIGRNYAGLFKLFAKPEQLARNIGGPVMIASMSNQVGAKGISYLVLFFGSISLILMIMNLLPIPILDGGHILFCIIEGIIRHPVSLKVQAILQRIGLTLLLLLMILAFYGDISKLLMRMMAN